MWAQIAFWGCAVGAVANGVAVFRVSSMARATFALLASFLFAAGTVLLLKLAYLGVLVILMMIMELVVMAVFMIMYMHNPAGLVSMTMVHNRKGSLAIAGVVFAALATAIFSTPWPTSPQPRPVDPTHALGAALMGSKMLVMMVLALCLFATIVATVVLAAHRGRYDRYGDRLAAERPDDPVRGGLDR